MNSEKKKISKKKIPYETVTLKVNTLFKKELQKKAEAKGMTQTAYIKSLVYADSNLQIAMKGLDRKQLQELLLRTTETINMTKEIVGIISEKDSLQEKQVIATCDLLLKSIKNKMEDQIVWVQSLGNIHKEI